MKTWYSIISAVADIGFTVCIITRLLTDESMTDVILIFLFLKVQAGFGLAATAQQPQEK